MKTTTLKPQIGVGQRLPGSFFLDEAVPPWCRYTTPSDSERGDVPGWVMVTLMTAGLVAVIFAVAKPALVELFNRAIDTVNVP